MQEKTKVDQAKTQIETELRELSTVSREGMNIAINHASKQKEALHKVRDLAASLVQDPEAAAMVFKQILSLIEGCKGLYPTES